MKNIYILALISAFMGLSGSATDETLKNIPEASIVQTISNGVIPSPGNWITSILVCSAINGCGKPYSEWVCKKLKEYNAWVQNQADAVPLAGRAIKNQADNLLNREMNFENFFAGAGIAAGIYLAYKLRQFTPGQLIKQAQALNEKLSEEGLFKIRINEKNPQENAAIIFATAHMQDEGHLVWAIKALRAQLIEIKYYKSKLQAILAYDKNYSPHIIHQIYDQLCTYESVCNHNNNQLASNNNFTINESLSRQLDTNAKQNNANTNKHIANTKRWKLFFDITKTIASGTWKVSKAVGKGVVKGTGNLAIVGIKSILGWL